MDIKIGGLTREIMRRRSSRRATARLHILGKMAETLAAAARPTSRRYAPRIATIKIKPDQIRDVIGPGGKIIRGIVEETGVQDRRRGRRHGATSRRPTATSMQTRHRHHPRAHRGGRGRQDLQRHGPQDRRLRRLRRDPARAPTAWCTSRSSPTSACGRCPTSSRRATRSTVKVLEVDKSGKIRLSRKEALKEAGPAGGAARSRMRSHPARRTASASSPRRCPTSPRSRSGSGSRTARATRIRRQAGISHFLEHLFFKGTERRTAARDRRGDRRRRRRAERVHRQGVHLLLRQGPARAPAARARPAGRHLPALALRERGDRARAHGHPPGDLAGRGHARTTTSTISSTWPSGRGIRSRARSPGSPDTVSRLTRDDFLRFLDARYRPDRDPDRGRGQRRARRSGRRSPSGSSACSAGSAPVVDGGLPSCRARRLGAHRSPSSRCTSASARPGSRRPTPTAIAAHLLNIALGGGMSSRLFQEIRERRGKAYTVYSFLSSYLDAGYVGVYVGTSAGVGARGGRGHPRRARPADARGPRGRRARRA